MSIFGGGRPKDVPVTGSDWPKSILLTRVVKEERKPSGYAACAAARASGLPASAAPTRLPRRCCRWRVSAARGSPLSWKAPLIVAVDQVGPALLNEQADVLPQPSEALLRGVEPAAARRRFSPSC